MENLVWFESHRLYYIVRWKVKGEVITVLKLQAMKTYGGMEVQHEAVLMLATDEGELTF